MVRQLRIIAADGDPAVRQFYEQALARLGHQAHVVPGGRQLVELCRAAPPDLVIADDGLADLGGVEAAEEIARERPVPVILVTACREPGRAERALAAPVYAYLLKPVGEGDLGPAIALAVQRFEQLQAACREAAELRQALEDRKAIERAKGAVMRRLRVDEAEAFRKLKKLASDKNFKVVEAARQVLAAEEVFGMLDRC